MNEQPPTADEIDTLRNRFVSARCRGDSLAAKRIESVLAHLANGMTLSSAALSQNVSRRALAKWIALYRAAGPQALENNKPRGRKPSMDEETQREMADEILSGKIQTEQDAIDWLRNRLGDGLKRATARYWYEKLMPKNIRNERRQTRRRRINKTRAV